MATLRALVDAGVSGLSYVPVVDPEAAAACHAAGEGAEVTVELGHKRDPRWGDSITCTGVVDTLSDGEVRYPGCPWEGHRTEERSGGQEGRSRGSAEH